MEIKITGTPEEIKELLQAIESSKEQNFNKPKFKINGQTINLD